MEGFSLRSSSSTEDSLGDRQQSIALYIYQCMHPRLCVIWLVLIDTVIKLAKSLLFVGVVYVRIISLRLQLIFLLGVCVNKIYAHLIEKEGWVVYN